MTLQTFANMAEEAALEIGVRTVAIYGGAFDPPHIGHVEVIRKTMELPDVSEVIVVPSRKPPHKIPTLSYRRRMHMMKLAMRDAFIKGTLDAKPLVSNVESHVGGTTYTVDMLQKLPQCSETLGYRLILGTDEVRSVMKWKCPDTIFDRFGMIIAERPESEPILRTGFSDVVLGAINRAWTFNVANEFAISSSSIRSSISAGSDWWRDFVSAPVCRYIQKNRLYGYRKET